MSAARPTLGLELAFAGGTVDVGESKGRQTGWASMRGTGQQCTTGFVAEAGYTNWTLDNRDRRFDPLRTSGPYYPDVTPGVDAQMVATWAATAHDVIAGKVDDFPQVFPVPATHREAVSPIRIVDAAGSLASMQIYNVPRPAERSGARMNAILDAIGWPGGRSIAAGNAIISPLERNQVSAWSHLQNVAMAEWGDFYIDSDNTIVFRSRDQIASESRSLTSQATYSDQVGATFQYSDIERATMPIYNDVTITFGSKGFQVNAQDATSIAAAWGLKSKQLSVPLHTQTQAQQYANWMVARYKNPVHTFSTVTFTPENNGAVLFPQLLVRKMSDMVTLTLDPLGDSDPIVRNVWIRGIAHAMDNDVWKSTKFWVQDASWISGLFHVGVDHVGSGSGSTNVLSF